MMHGTLPRHDVRIPLSKRFADWRLATKSIFGLWAFYALTVAARALLGEDPFTAVQNKLLTLIAGVLLTFLIYAAIALFARGRGTRRKTIVAAIGCTLAAWAMAGMLIAAEGQMRESREEFRINAREGYVIVQQGGAVRIERARAEPLVLTLPRVGELDAAKRFRVAADAAVIWFFFFAAWSAFYLAQVVQRQALSAQRRAAEAEASAKAAQVRALRYQVNPHFLFNTLNSLSSLVMSQRTAEAESMILRLSNFFRSTLSLDPSADVSLAEEIALQQLYLDIEQVRFPRRLKTEIDIPKALEIAQLPALILQPLVENVFKYAVSPTRDKIELRIAAREAGPGRFILEVVNSGGTSSAPRKKGQLPPESTGVGLANVCQRLQARFGAAAQCRFGPDADGGYRVTMTLPLVRHDG